VTIRQLVQELLKAPDMDAEIYADVFDWIDDDVPVLRAQFSSHHNAIVVERSKELTWLTSEHDMAGALKAMLAARPDPGCQEWRDAREMARKALAKTAEADK
jgi:hypothetical protein